METADSDSAIPGVPRGFGVPLSGLAEGSFPLYRVGNLQPGAFVAENQSHGRNSAELGKLPVNAGHGEYNHAQTAVHERLRLDTSQGKGHVELGATDSPSDGVGGPFAGGPTEGASGEGASGAGSWEASGNDQQGVPGAGAGGYGQGNNGGGGGLGASDVAGGDDSPSGNGNGGGGGREDPGDFAEETETAPDGETPDFEFGRVQVSAPRPAVTAPSGVRRYQPGIFGNEWSANPSGALGGLAEAAASERPGGHLESWAPLQVGSYGAEDAEHTGHGGHGNPTGGDGSQGQMHQGTVLQSDIDSGRTRRRCPEPGCGRYPNYSHPSMDGPRFCSKHKQPGMVDAYFHTRRICKQQGCNKEAGYGPPNSHKRLYCGTHRPADMVKLRKSNFCEDPNCSKQPSFNFPGNTRPILCGDHRQPGMVNLRKGRVCEHPGCNIHASFSHPDRLQVSHCAEHKEEGMVDRLQEVARCVEVGCKGAARFSRPGDSVVSYCRRHKQPGMVEPSPRKRKPPPRGGFEIRDSNPAGGSHPHQGLHSPGGASDNAYEGSPSQEDPNKRHRALGPEDPSPRGARIQQWPGEFASGPLSEAAGAGPEVTAAMPPPFSESFTDASQPAVLLATGIPMSLAGYTPDPSQAPPAAPGDAYVGLNPQPNPPPSGFLEGP